ncbi:hypothetical protein AB1Y20_014955 [Prymnesium parvum]|uniref:Glycosyl transferase family 1 domain-containing protein n=1 Tax=Prymnesium parvum TaxID=97485 RepID=A0AB34JZC7_PRYPA
MMKRWLLLHLLSNPGETLNLVENLDRLPPNMVPMRLLSSSEGPVLTFCLNALLFSQPVELAPFFDNLLAASGCHEEARTLAIKLDDLLRLLSFETPENRWPLAVDGFLVHAMRVGSTAAANLIGAHDDVAMLKEPAVLADVLDVHGVRGSSHAIPEAHPLHGRRFSEVPAACRAVMQLFRRAAEWQAQLSGSLVAGAGWHPEPSRLKLLVKLPTAGTAAPLSLSLLRAAFPRAPFAYMIRDPSATLASLLAPASRVELIAAPCLRWRGRHPTRQLPGLLRRAAAVDPLSLPAEAYCASHLASLLRAMRAQIEADAAAGLPHLLLDHSRLRSDGVADDFLLLFGLPPPAEPTARRMARAAAVDAKRPSRGEGRSASPTPPSPPSATATSPPNFGAGVEYERLKARGAPDMAARVAAAEAAARRAAGNASVAEGTYIHSAGVGEWTVRRGCGRGSAGAEGAAEEGVRRFARGDLLGAEACWLEALGRTDGESAQRDAILTNLASVEDVLSRETPRRVYVSSTPPRPVLEEETVDAAVRFRQEVLRARTGARRPSDDLAVALFDDALSDAWCDRIIGAFEREGVAEHYAGNVGTAEGFAVKEEAKMTTEIDISHSPNEVWDDIDFVLLQALTAALPAYAIDNPGFAKAAQPLGDEGFRLKRYRAVEAGRPAEHHTWHADTATTAVSCRMVAVLFYLNTVRPRRGSLLLFPASFSYFHAAAPPVSEHKYVVSNFLTLCEGEASRPLAPLPLHRRHRLRHAWKGPVLSWAPPPRTASPAGDMPARGGATGGEGGVCGAPFLERVAAELEALQSPAECGTARLLVAGGAARDFDGLGSVLLGVAEAQAQAYYSRRTLLWGPAAAHPAFLREGACNAAVGFDCWFAPLGHCRWEHHVYREEARALASAPFADSARVALAHARRGGPALYSVPEHLLALLPHRVASDAAAAAECWAGAVVGRVLRLREDVQRSMRTAWESTVGEAIVRGVSGVHLRRGDVANVMSEEHPTQRMYTNRRLLTVEELATALLESFRRDAASPQEGIEPTATVPGAVYFATDAEEAPVMAEQLRLALGPKARVLLLPEVLRLREGTHAHAFAPVCLAGACELPLPLDLSRKIRDQQSPSAAELERVRREALFDLFALSCCTAHAGSATSTFAVVGRLWAGMGRGVAVTSSAGWADAREAAAGHLATGFLHGMRKGIGRLIDGAERLLVVRSRLLDREVTAADPAVEFDSLRAIPIIPRLLFSDAASRWASYSTADLCECDARLDPESRGGAPAPRSPTRGCDAVVLLNEGAQAADGTRMNDQMSLECWRRGLMIPGRSAVAEYTSMTRASEAADIMRENRVIVLNRVAEKFLSYAAGYKAVRGVPLGSSHEGAGVKTIQLHFEGWRGVPHSYAATAHTFLAELATRPAVRLSWSDYPAPRAWAERGMDYRLPPGVEERPPSSVPEGALVLRIAWPPNLAPAIGAARTFVFLTAEHLSCPDASLKQQARAPWDPSVTVVTPSYFSLEGLAACGIPRTRIAVVRHGVQSAPLGDQEATWKARLGERNRRGWERRFVMLHVGSATPNKNIRMLLAAFEDTLVLWKRAINENNQTEFEGRPMLVLQGLDGLYQSSKAIQDALLRHELRAHHGESIRDHDGIDVHVVGDRLTVDLMARLYAAADTYVSASQAEAFQIPLIEAAAAGLPLIVPSGGAAEEVANFETTVFVASILRPRPNAEGFLVQPEQASLAKAMLRAVNDMDLRSKAQQRNPRWVASYFSHTNAADSLLGVLVDPRFGGKESDLEPPAFGNHSFVTLPRSTPPVQRIATTVDGSTGLATVE